MIYEIITFLKFYIICRLKMRALLMSGIGKVYQVVKNIDASDVSKLAKSPNGKKAVNESVSEIGEALAGVLSKSSTDVSSSIIPAGGETALTTMKEVGEKTANQSTEKGFWSWIKNLFKGKKTNTNSTTKVTTNAATPEVAEQTANVQNQNVVLKKQNKKLEKDKNEMQKANKKAQNEIKKLTEKITAYEKHMEASQIKQAEVDQMSWLQKLFSSECRFNWDNFKWEAV